MKCLKTQALFLSKSVKCARCRARGGTVEEQPVLIQPSDGSAGCSEEPAQEGRSVKSPAPGGSFCTRVCSWCQEPTATGASCASSTASHTHCVVEKSIHFLQHIQVHSLEGPVGDRSVLFFSLSKNKDILSPDNVLLHENL